MPTGAGTRPDPHHRAIALVVGALVVALVAGVWAAAVRTDAAQLERPARWGQLIELVHRVQATTEDELNVLARHAVEAGESAAPGGRRVEDVAAARAAAVRTLQDELADSGDDPIVGWAARALSDVYDDLTDGAAPEATLSEVVDRNDRALRRIETAAADDDVALALVQLVEHASLPRLVVNDVLDALHVRGGAEPAAWAADYFDEAVGYLATEPGWLGGDPSTPLTSPYVASDQLQVQLPDAWAGLTSLGDRADARVLVRIDEWVRGWSGPTTGPPPHTLEEVTRAADAVARDIDALVVATTADVIGTADARARSARRTSAALAVIALASATAAVIVIGRTMSRRRGRTRAWRSAALSDQLTALANRRGLTEHAARVAASGTAGHALLLFDLDHFKGINDRFGHAVGDAVLCSIADRARAVVVDHAGDPGCEVLVARLGGDEFVILISGAAEPAAIGDGVAAALVDAVHATPLDDGEVTVPLSVSVGIAAHDGPLSLEDLLLQADIALYDVKRTGRGSHRVFVPGAPLAGA